MVKIFTVFLSSMLCLSAFGNEFSYGTFTPGRDIIRGWSAFTTIEDSGCSLPVQIYLANGATATSDQIQFFSQAIIKVVQSWASALDNNSYWRCKNSTWVSWSNADARAIKVYVDAQVSRSYAIVGSNQIFISPQYLNASDQFSERVILHEFGHMFGLADTYTEPGYQQPIGQPEGVMNQLYNVDWLTDDDLAGAYSLYEYINGRGQFCNNNYGVGGAYENKNRIAFCVPL